MTFGEGEVEIGYLDVYVCEKFCLVEIIYLIYKLYKY